jgi:ribosomal protein L12E/L44/L45/RPP1/RPP2
LLSSDSTGTVVPRAGGDPRKVSGRLTAKEKKKKKKKKKKKTEEEHQEKERKKERRTGC